MTEPLNPCPFCASPPELDEGGAGPFVACTNDACDFFGPTPDADGAKWNSIVVLTPEMRVLRARRTRTEMSDGEMVTRAILGLIAINTSALRTTPYSDTELDRELKLRAEERKAEAAEPKEPPHAG